MGQIREVTLALPVVPAYTPLDPHYRGWFELSVSDEELVTFRAVARVMSRRSSIRATALRARGCFLPPVTNPAFDYQLGQCEVSLVDSEGEERCKVCVRATFVDGADVRTCYATLEQLRTLFAEAIWYGDNGGQNHGPHPYPALLPRWSRAARELFARRYPSTSGFWENIQEAA
jgi:hypothetical protein